MCCNKDSNAPAFLPDPPAPRKSVSGSTDAFQDEVKAKRLKAMGLTREAVEAKIAERMAARADKEWARADAIRDELHAMQIVVMGRTDGWDWRGPRTPSRG